MTQANEKLIDDLTDDVSLDTIFEKHPSEVKDEDLDRYIEFLRRERAAWMLKQDKKGKSE